jgi:hypothetical protein
VLKVETKSLVKHAKNWRRKVGFDWGTEAVKGLPVEARTEFWRTYWSVDPWCDREEVSAWVALVERRVIAGKVTGKGKL